MRKIIRAAYLLLLALATPAVADDRQDCASDHSNRKLEACAALIKSGGMTGLDLAAAYRNRGVAHAAKREHDQAIADFSKAIELNPNYVKAYNDRAVAYTQKGDFQHAVADVTKAVELAPKSAPKPAATAAHATNPGPNSKKPAPGQPSAGPAATIGVFRTSVIPSPRTGEAIAPPAGLTGGRAIGQRGDPFGGSNSGYGQSGGYGASSGYGAHGDSAGSSGSGSSGSGSSGSGSSGSGGSGGGGSGGGGGGGGGGSGSGGK
jgi:tetratricopeptide (TPR) repeat protein